MLIFFYFFFLLFLIPACLHYQKSVLFSFLKLKTLMFYKQVTEFKKKVTNQTDA